MKLMKIIKSNRKNKKYVAYFKLDSGKEKAIHFGASGYRDYTLMSDKTSKFYEKSKVERDKVKAAYIARHSSEDWSKPDTAGTLSRYILWSTPSLGGSIRAFRKRFGV